MAARASRRGCGCGIGGRGVAVRNGRAPGPPAGAPRGAHHHRGGRRPDGAHAPGHVRECRRRLRLHSVLRLRGARDRLSRPGDRESRDHAGRCRQGIQRVPHVQHARRVRAGGGGCRVRRAHHREQPRPRSGSGGRGADARRPGRTRRPAHGQRAHRRRGWGDPGGGCARGHGGDPGVHVRHERVHRACRQAVDGQRHR